MSTHELADKAMKEVVFALDTTECKRIDRLSSTDGLLDLTRDHRPDLAEGESSRIEAWRAGSDELCKIADNVRKSMKIHTP